MVTRCRELTVAINALERELRDRVCVLAPSLLAVPGCGVLGAATIVGETASARRFRSRNAFARFTGTAPIPVWSGNTAGKVRLNRGGNRRMNCALHTRRDGLRDHLPELADRRRAGRLTALIGEKAA